MAKYSIDTKENADIFISAWEQPHRRGLKKYIVRVGSGAIGTVLFLVMALIWIAIGVSLYGGSFYAMDAFYLYLVIEFIVGYLAGLLIAYFIWRKREALYAQALKKYPRVRTPWDDPELSSRFTTAKPKPKKKK
ncbi:hypothetical protein H8699_04060 [Christensenellaceae bacterium NSJ-44]|uniref:Uncharacterized protein n=1 Tax=Luoshenia tenuis TaxID=2763654 RepID=A0A926CZS6_9FIRM|nr:hypothetical protein [Luoshenia tenuis]MBC8528611.1 hypothetical protein [Luoshenia tenuis]